MLFKFLISLFQRPKHDLIIIDDQFPQPYPFGFRNFEINGILKNIPSSIAFSMFPIKPKEDAWFSHCYGIKKKKFKKNLKNYLMYYPENRKRIHYLPKHLHSVQLCYSYFLAQTYTLLPYLEKNKIPFVFVLYPEGAFGLNNPSSDAMCKRIFSSPYFRGVIVTQHITRNYLLEKKLCPKKLIHYEFGTYIQFFKNEIPNKIYYPQNKNTLDICFVACKYSSQGVDKGYDLFIETAKQLSPKYSFVRFHVVGNFTPNDIDISSINDRITFYGFQNKDFLLKFYSQMDICISPNRLEKLYHGNFDGFPLGADALAFGCTLLTTDELKNNDGFTDNKDIVIIKPEINHILKKCIHLIENIPQMYQIGKQGQIRCFELLDPESRLKNITQFLSQIIKQETIK